MIASLVILIFCISGAFGFLSGKRGESIKRKRLSDREDIPLSKWAHTYYPQFSENSVRELLVELALPFDISPGLLRPHDHIFEILGSPKGYFVAGEWDEFNFHLARRAQLLGCSIPRPSTVGEYIQFFSESREERMQGRGQV